MEKTAVFGKDKLGVRKFDHGDKLPRSSRKDFSPYMLKTIRDVKVLKSSNQEGIKIVIRHNRSGKEKVS